MNGLRFQPGEAAVFAVATDPSGLPGIGAHVDVLLVGPIQAGDVLRYGEVFGVAHADADYLIDWPDGEFGLVRDWQLRKINPPAEPESITRQLEVTA